VQVRALAVKCRLANAISGKSNAVYKVVTCVTELTRLLLAVFERFRPKLKQLVQYQAST